MKLKALVFRVGVLYIQMCKVKNKTPHLSSVTDNKVNPLWDNYYYFMQTVIHIVP
jgi:hypothetical protein